MLEGIQNIIFDLGGVLVDLNREASVEAYRALGLENADALLDNYSQKGIFRQLEMGEVTTEQFCAEVRRQIGKPVTDEAICAALEKFVVDIPAYKLEMLLELKKRYRIFMLSNTNPIVMRPIFGQFFRKQGLEAADYFDHMFLSYEMGMAKPDPSIFERTLKEGQMNPEETLFLDDGAANIAMAKPFGVRTYQVTAGEDYRGIFKAYAE